MLFIKEDRTAREFTILRIVLETKEKDEDTLKEFLFDTEQDGKMEEKKAWLYELWKARQMILKRQN